MSLILQIETSTTTCSVALANNGKIISCSEQTEKNIHASSITLFIEKVLKEAGTTTKDLNAVAVSKGPGSYTGLRIGVSTGKGLCYALDIPLISVSTLKAMAFGLKASKMFSESTLFCPMIDARRMEVYTAVYNSNFEEVSPVEAKIIDEMSFSSLLNTNEVIFFGDGSSKCESILRDKKNAIFYANFLNSAKDLTILALDKFQAGNFENVAYFEPYYLKDFIGTKPSAKSLH